jgi:hypothetical protein
MQKVKSKVEICKLPSMTLVFLPRYREALKLPPSPRWSPSQGIPRKGQAPIRVTPWIAPVLPHAQVGLRCAFWQASLGPLPTVFTIKLPPSPRWSPSQGIPRKGQAPIRVTPWIALVLPHAQVGLRCAFWQASLRLLPTVFTIELSTEPSRALLPSVHGGGHTTSLVGVVSQDYKPHQCISTVHASTFG